jgi:LacI family transcriptional regulator
MMDQEMNQQTSNESSNGILALVVADINNPFFADIVKGVNKVARVNGYTVYTCDTDETVRNELSVLLSIKQQRFDGLIITPVSEQACKNARLLESIQESDIPIVLIDREVKSANFDGVFIDNHKGAFDGVEALIRAGHRNIAIITGPTTSKPGKDRLKGYQEAMQLYNIPVNEALVQHGDFRWASGYYLTQRLMQMETRPSAIFVSNNLMSIGCIKALTELHLQIPDDVSLLAFDDSIALNAISRNISIINRSATQMGIEAATILIDRIRNNEKSTKRIPKRVVLLPKLELRGSEIAASKL